MRRDGDEKVAAVDAARSASADISQNGSHTADLPDVLLDLQHDVVHSGNTDAFGSVDLNLELRFIDIARNIVLPDHLRQRNRRSRDKNANHYDRDPMLHGPRQHPCVHLIDSTIETRFGSLGAIARMPGRTAQHPCAHHRRQRE